MNDLSSLIERVERATGPDRETDEAIARLSNWCPLEVASEMWTAEDEKPEYWFSDAFGMPCFTSSIDAALALTERRGFAWDAVLDEALSDVIERALERADCGGDASPRISELPLAIILALLRALQSSHPATASGIVERESGDAT